MKNDKRSLVLLTTSMVIFGTIGIFRRYIPWSSSLLSMIRGIIGSAFLLLFCTVTKKKFSEHLETKKLVLLIVTGALIGLNWMLLFEAYNYTTVATTTLCYYMEPTIVILLAPIFFKEKLTLKKGICAALAVIGMAFVAGIVKDGIPSLDDAKGILYGLGAALLYSIVVIINKKLPGINPYQKTMIQLLFAAVVMIPYVLFTVDFSGMEASPVIIIMVLIVGLIHTGTAYALYFGSMDGLKAQTVALLSYIDPVVALILSGLILGEEMGLMEIIGMVLILGATFISETEFKKTVCEN